MKENKSDYKDLSIKEMTDKEFSNFLRWKEEIVYGEMGCNPTEECLVGMWEMWKHLHKPIDEDELDDLSYDVGEEKSRIYGYDNEYENVVVFCNGFKHGLLYSMENKYSV